MDAAPIYTDAPGAQQPQNIYKQMSQDAQQQQQYAEKGAMIQTQAAPVQHQPQDTPSQPLFQPQDTPAQPPVQPLFQPRVYKTATPLNVLGRSGAPADCPACGQRSMTRITTVIGNSNHVYAGIAFVVTGICCFIPYLMDAIKDVEHRCGSCGVLLATVHKSGRVDVHQYH